MEKLRGLWALQVVCEQQLQRGLAVFPKVTGMALRRETLGLCQQGWG